MCIKKWAQINALASQSRPTTGEKNPVFMDMTKTIIKMGRSRPCPTCMYCSTVLRTHTQKNPEHVRESLFESTCLIMVVRSPPSVHRCGSGVLGRFCCHLGWVDRLQPDLERKTTGCFHLPGPCTLYTVHSSPEFTLYCSFWDQVHCGHLSRAPRQLPP